MALSLSETKAILQALGVRPKRKWGQNFLIDPQIVHRSVEWAHLSPNEMVVEIGPGCGTLTDQLVAAQARVFAVEKEAAFASYLSQQFPIDCLQGDALQHPLGRFQPSAPYKVAANLPYAIASVWLDTLLEQSRLPEIMVLLVQKEVANRWLAAAGTKHFSALSISLQAAYALQQKCNVSKRCFYPQPKVDSMLICLQKRTDGWISPKNFKQWMRNIFLHRRQQLARVCKKIPSQFAEPFLTFLASQGIPQTVRAEAIPLERWVQFAKTIPPKV